MGSKVGHVGPGFGFLIIGLWHLYNNIKLFSLHRASFRTLPWFPFPKFRQFELLLISLGCLTSISMELFVGPARHQPLDPDFTIPSNHLHNFEHALIALSILIYAVFATVFDRISSGPINVNNNTFVFMALSAAFGHEWLLFYLHSTDHTGLEGQYHWLLRIIILISFLSALFCVAYPCNFAAAFVNSASITAQGLWFIILGYALWTPALIPKGCYMHDEDGHFVVRCRSDEALERAKSLANIEFSAFMSAALVLSFLSFIFLSRRIENEYGYTFIQVDEIDDLELQKKINSKLEE